MEEIQIIKTKQELLQIISECTGISLQELNSDNLYLDEEQFYSEDNNFLENDDYRVEVESIRGSEGDGAEMFFTVKITDKETKEEYFIEFFGRYSSWDSSRFYKSYVVEPYLEMVTFYRKVPEAK